MKILFVCRSFNNMAGGVERMAAALMNEMCARGHDVGLLTWDEAGARAFYDFDPRITWMNLDMGSHLQKAGWALRLRRMVKMRRIISSYAPDVILAFQHGTFLATRLYCVGLSLPIIAAEREAPARFEHIKAGRWQGFIYQSFRLAHKITIQCECYRAEYPAYLRHKIVTISNPVFPAQSFAKPSGDGAVRKILLCAGRLSYQKNQAVLLKAFALLAVDFSNWDLHLVGEGEDRPALEKLRADLGLQTRIFMNGAQKDMAQIYTGAHLLVLPARWEGFPNVIAEALSHGLPCVGFAGCAGTRDLIRDGVNGLLAAWNDNADTLAQTLKTLVRDDAARARMGAQGIEDMKAYAPAVIFTAWENLLREVAGR